MHREGQFGLEYRASVVFEAAHDRGVDRHAVGVAGGRDQRCDLGQLVDALRAASRARHRLAKIADRLVGVGTARVGKAEHAPDRLHLQARAPGEVAALVATAGPEQRLDTIGAEPVEFVDGTQHGQASAGIRRRPEADRLQDAVQHFTIIDLHDVVAA